MTGRMNPLLIEAINSEIGKHPDPFLENAILRRLYADGRTVRIQNISMGL